MCGIFGFSELNDATRKMAPFVAHEMMHRGEDSWGASNGVEVIKHLGPIAQTFEIPPHWNRGIFHTRAASVGAVTTENAHPFTFSKADGTNIIGIHNGGISNYQAINTKYTRNFDVDSMHLFKHLAEGRDFSDLTGYGAIAWYENGDLWLSKFNGGALEVVKLSDGTIAFASTRDALVVGAPWAGLKIEVTYQIPTETRIHVQMEGGKALVYTGARLPFGFRYEFKAPPYNIYQSAIASGSRENSGDCSTSGCKKCNKKWAECKCYSARGTSGPVVVVRTNSQDPTTNCIKCNCVKHGTLDRMLCKHCELMFEKDALQMVVHG